VCGGGGGVLVRAYLIADVDGVVFDNKCVLATVDRRWLSEERVSTKLLVHREPEVFIRAPGKKKVRVHGDNE
jgi:hypothetical protein